MNKSEELFWEASDPDDINNLKKWVSDNVLSAIEQSVDETEAWINIKEGSIEIQIGSFEKPDGTDCFHKTFDLIEMVETLLVLYGSDENEIEKACQAFDNLAISIRKMAKQKD